MKVYVVILNDVESNTILGIFRTEVGAKKAKEERGRTERYVVQTPAWAIAHRWKDADIETWDLEP